MRCSTLKIGLSLGSRSLKLLPVLSGRYGIKTVNATAAATQARTTTQRSVVTVKRYARPKPDNTKEAAVSTRWTSFTGCALHHRRSSSCSILGRRQVAGTDLKQRVDYRGRRVQRPSRWWIPALTFILGGVVGVLTVGLLGITWPDFLSTQTGAEP